MQTTPWWYAVVATATGGLLTLLATVLTAWLTNKNAANRQIRELEHQRDMERDKHLYDRRLELYAEVMPLAEALVDAIEEMRAALVFGKFATKGNPNYSKALSAVASLRKLFHTVVLISTNEVGSEILELMDEGERSIDALKELREEDLVDEDGDLKVAVLRFEVGRLIRIEVGSGTPEDYENEDEDEDGVVGTEDDPPATQPSKAP
ncbi:hypothetical protein [Amycolatopsis minnesotensis]|uniref:Uncharacterized protein n=1 Tax=Amycolatopsis minnesotensis TaxID=337894 RepID=A0ABN2Q369_9PSEU